VKIPQPAGTPAPIGTLPAPARRVPAKRSPLFAWLPSAAAVVLLVTAVAGARRYPRAGDEALNAHPQPDAAVPVDDPVTNRRGASGTGTPGPDLPALGTVTPAVQGSSDIFLVRLRDDGGRTLVDSVRRVTNRDGYDNQPSFTPDGTAILYTSIDAAGQADIRRYDIVRGTDAPLIRTSPESEYSAAVMPGGQRIAVIRVERDSTQRLWSFRTDGSDPRVVLENVKPAGYFAFLDANRIALFVLGNPATLQLADVRTGASRLLANGIGRSLHRVPGRDAVSFVSRPENGQGWISILDLRTDSTTRVVQPFAENEYHAWTADGELVTGRGGKLYRMRPGRDSGWVELADLAPFGVAGISRLAVSADARTIAIVATH
jgi:WD40-like Beta Propeller Repeat